MLCIAVIVQIAIHDCVTQSIIQSSHRWSDFKFVCSWKRKSSCTEPSLDLWTFKIVCSIKRIKLFCWWIVVQTVFGNFADMCLCRNASKIFLQVNA